MADERREAGTAIRREMFGDEYVDAMERKRTPFNSDFRDFLAGTVYGTIWSRPALDRRTRSCITVAMLVALGHYEELPLHVRGALKNGVTRDELREVLLQTAVYAGVPAANTAFAVAGEALKDADPAPA